MWGCYLLAEQQAISLMMVIKSSFMTIITNLYISVMILVLGTGALRYNPKKKKFGSTFLSVNFTTKHFQFQVIFEHIRLVGLLQLRLSNAIRCCVPQSTHVRWRSLEEFACRNGSQLFDHRIRFRILCLSLRGRRRVLIRTLHSEICRLQHIGNFGFEFQPHRYIYIPYIRGRLQLFTLSRTTARFH